MVANVPELQRLAMMPGPNLFGDLPGVRLEIAWPEAAASAGPGEARRAMLRLLENATLQRFAASTCVAELESIADGPRSLDRLVEVVADAVMRMADQPMEPVGRSHALRAMTGGAFVHHRDVVLAVHAGRTAMALAGIALEQNASSPATPASVRIEQLLAEFRSRWHHMGLSEQSWRKIDTAERRGIPWRRLVDRDRLIQLGHGSRQARIRGAMIERDSHIATYLATHKHIASELMRANGLPAPRNFAVLSQASALQAARTLGYPVVVKPAMTDFGTAVSVNLQSDEAVTQAFEQARRHGPVVVEKHVQGTHYRLLVMHGKFHAAVRQEPAHVIGDGLHRVGQLVQLANHDRSDELSASLKKISIDEDALRILRQQGLAMDSVPALGRRVLLREHSNLSVGGTYHNATASVHADNRMLAERAAQVFGLQVAGIDFITTDVSRSHLEVGGSICEINPTPGFVMGESGFSIEEAFLDGLFSEGSNGRIPIIATFCDHDIDELTGRLEAIAVALGHRPFVVTPSAIRCGGRRIAAGSSDQAFAIGAALQDPSATAAIVQLTRQGTLQAGLVFDRCTLAIVVRRTDAAGATAPTEEIDRAIGDLLARQSQDVLHVAEGPAFDAAVHAALGASA